VNAIALKHDIYYRDTSTKKGKLICDEKLLEPLSQTKTKGIRESFDKHLVQAAIETNINLVLEQTTANGVVEKRFS